MNYAENGEMMQPSTVRALAISKKILPGDVRKEKDKRLIIIEIA